MITTWDDRVCDEKRYLLTCGHLTISRWGADAGGRLYASVMLPTARGWPYAVVWAAPGGSHFNKAARVMAWGWEATAARAERVACLTAERLSIIL